MGNISNIDQKIINDIIQSDNKSTFFCPLTINQCNNIFKQYNYLCSNENNMKKIINKNSNILNYDKIGTYNGDIIAFNFENNKKPFILFEFNNKNFQSSHEIIIRSYSVKNNNNRSKYNDYSSMRINCLKITTIYIDDNDFCKEFYFVINVEE